jgi:4-hydroxy-tetrahydrodipicolinate synthase
MFQGTYTALVTPFANNRVDEKAFERLIESQIDAGITGIVAVGTTGESPTLDHLEHRHVIEMAVKFAKGRCQVIAGTGSNSTTEAVSLTVESEKLGAQAALVVAPYYNKPSQEGVFRHYKAIADASTLPIILYSIPGRCGIEIGVDTCVRLAEQCPSIVAIKEAGGSVERVHALRAALPSSFEILSGDDSLTLPFMASGAVGVISVASNLVPARVCDLVNAATRRDYEEARKIHYELYSLFKDLFLEPNPVPVKYALAKQGLMQADVRLPLCELSAGSIAKLETTLRALQLA